MNGNIHRSVASIVCGAVVALALAMFCSSCSSTGGRTGPELVPLTGSPSGDYARLEGSWVVTYNEMKKVALTEMAGATFHFKDNRHWVSGDSGFEWFAVDSSRNPKAIDFYDNRSPTVRGIYELNGSELVLCTAAPGKPRPTKFGPFHFRGRF